MDRKPDAPEWLGALRIYLAVIAAGNLTWEALQTPLYTIWRNGSRAEIAFAVLHCTAGDIVIALTAVALALLLVGERAWPARGFGRVLGFTLLFGFGYTVFSEWRNLSRQAWAYSDLMPVISLFGTGIGLSPLLQWLLIPPLAFLVTWRRNAANSMVDSAGNGGGRG